MRTTARAEVVSSSLQHQHRARHVNRLASESCGGLGLAQRTKRSHIGAGQRVEASSGAAHARGNPEQSNPSIRPEHVGAAVSKLVSASIGDIAVVFSRSPRHKHYSLADIEWLIVPAVVTVFGAASPVRLISGSRTMQANELSSGQINGHCFINHSDPSHSGPRSNLRPVDNDFSART